MSVVSIFHKLNHFETVIIYLHVLTKLWYSLNFEEIIYQLTVVMAYFMGGFRSPNILDHRRMNGRIGTGGLKGI